MFATTTFAQVQSPSRGAYTEKQSSRGEVIYQKQCSNCHGPSLRGDGFAPPLAGEAFLRQWQDATAWDLITAIQATMPVDRPGSLGADDARDVVAYLLRTNEFPPADDELVPESALKQFELRRGGVAPR